MLPSGHSLRVCCRRPLELHLSLTTEWAVLALHLAIRIVAFRNWNSAACADQQQPHER